MDPATRQKKNSRRAVSNPMASNGGLEGIDNARRVSGGRGGAEGRKLCARNRRKSLQMYRFRWRRFIRRDVSLQRRDRRGRARARARVHFEMDVNAATYQREIASGSLLFLVVVVVVDVARPVVKSTFNRDFRGSRGLDAARRRRDPQRPL